MLHKMAATRIFNTVGILLFTWCTSAYAVDNLIANGDFEQAGLSSWTSPKSSTTLSQSPSAAYSGGAGLAVSATDSWCPNGAIYTFDTSRFVSGTLYEFDARVRLAAGGTPTNLHMGLLKNRAKSPLWLDGEQSSYDGGVYTDRWTRLHGAYIAKLKPSDTLKLCISGAAGQTVYIDELTVSPLTPATTGYSAPINIDDATRIRVDNQQLVLGNPAQPFTINGINLYLYDNGYAVGKGKALTNFKFKNADEAAYQEIHALGFNTVRLMLSYLLFEDNARPGVYKPEGWAVLERHILWAQKYQLRLVLDMHEVPGGYQSSDGFKSFGSRRDLKKRLENLWLAIAARYRYENTIIAYDLLNEPYVLNWFDYAETLVQKIRTVDTFHAVVVEESFHPRDPGLRLLPDSNVLYDIHFYSPFPFTSVASDTSSYNLDIAWFKSTLRDYLPASFYDAALDRFTVPIHIGEYGVVHEKYENNLGAQQWMRDITAAFNAR
jgi:endoglucanase